MDTITVALAKGRLADDAFKLLTELDIYNGIYEKNSRKLIFSDGEMRLILVKANDVPTYVQRGAADLGICGKDSLLEEESDVYELLDLGFGSCQMAVAAKNGFKEHFNRPLRVASKYPTITKKFYEKKQRQIDIIKLGGSVELAPILDLSDVIVDVVQTGTTLKENGLSVIESICEISARLVANKVSLKTKADRIKNITIKLEERLCR